MRIIKIVKVQRVHENTLSIYLPQKIVKHMGLNGGDEVVIVYEDGVIHIAKLSDVEIVFPKKKRTMTGDIDEVEIK